MKDILKENWRFSLTIIPILVSPVVQMLFDRFPPFVYCLGSICITLLIIIFILVRKLNSRRFLPERIKDLKRILPYSVESVKSTINFTSDNGKDNSLWEKVCTEYVIKRTDIEATKINLPQLFRGSDYDFQEWISDNWRKIPYEDGKISNAYLWESQNQVNKSGCCFELTDSFKSSDKELKIKIIDKVAYSKDGERVFTHRVLLGVKKMEIVVKHNSHYQFTKTPQFIAKCQDNKIPSEITSLKGSVSSIPSEHKITIEYPIPEFKYGFEFGIKKNPSLGSDTSHDIIDC